MRGYELKQTLRRGGTICGSLVVSPSPKWLKYVPQAGMDFVFIDTEHVLLDSMTLSWMCMAYSAAGLAPIVRLPTCDPARATAVLDGGAQGILVPYVESVEEVRRMVGAVHCRPVKGEKLRAHLSGEHPFPPALQEALAQNNRDNLLLINVESVTAAEKLDDLLDVPGLDGIVIGPNDLSYSMDRPNDYQDAAFQAAVRDILRRARAKGVAAGVHALGPIAQQIAWARDTGMNMLFHSGDIYAFVAGMREDIGTFRQALNLSDSAAGDISVEI